VSEILNSVSDDKSVIILDTIAAQPAKSGILKRTTNLTRKQYYLRISKLTDSGVIARKRGRYHITAFGKVIYEAQKLIRKAIENYSKLEAINSIESSSVSHDLGLPAEERNRIIDVLLEGNDNIKEILIRGN